MRPISKPRAPLAHAERHDYVIDWLAWQARRDRPESRARLADAEARLVTAGIDPWWSSAEFWAWVDGGE